MSLLEGAKMHNCQKHTFSWLSLALIPFLIFLGGFLPLEANAEILAGAAKVSITPDPKAMPYTLGGYVTPERLSEKATGIHDTCYARALVLTNGKTKCALVSLDLCFLPSNVKEAVATRIAKTGVPPSGLFLAATHSHSAPDPLMLHSGNQANGSALPTFDSKLLEWFAERIAQAITEANDKLRPAHIGSGQMQGLGLNRNRRDEKLTDDEMTLLKVTDPAGQPLAAIFNYAAHPVYYGAEMMEVSGDWSGTFQRQMEALLPGAVVLFLNGAEGDASPNGADEGTPAEKIDTYSAKLTEKACSLYSATHVSQNANLDAWIHTIQLPDRRPHPFFLLAASRFQANAQQARALVNRMMPERSELSFLRVGDVLFIGMPGEPTAAVGLAAKALAKEKGIPHPAVVALTNGWLGYLVTAEQYKAGKYEASMSFYGEEIGACILTGVRAGLERMH
jgi:neutral ceramidase